MNPDEGELVDDDDISEDRSQLRSVRVQYQGPLPPASEYASYEATTPGAGDRILALTEEQSKHRRMLELEESRAFREQCAEEIRLEGRRTFLGQIFAAIALILLTLVAWRALELGHAKTAGTIITVGLVAVVAIFVTGKFATKSESEDVQDGGDN